MSQTYTFHRDGSFFSISLVGEAAAIRVAENNPGISKVTDAQGSRTVWEAKQEAPASEEDLNTKLNAALARIQELETAFRTTRDRLSFHDGCSRFNVRDLVILRDADVLLHHK